MIDQTLCVRGASPTRLNFIHTMVTTMVHAYHVAFGAYGFWLPNDPRGSWSTFVGSWELRRFGQATKVTDRHSLARNQHDHKQRQAAKEVLKFPPVVFTGHQAVAVAAGFQESSVESGYTLFACAILPEHVHLVIGRQEREIKRVVGHLKGRATQRLKTSGHWTNAERPVWSRGCWTVFLNSPDDVWRAIRYVEENPSKEGKRRQHWSCVTPYDGSYDI